MRYLQFNKEEWGRLRAQTPLSLTEEDLVELRGINERISLEEVTLVYLPLSRLLNLYVAATQRLRQTTDTFLGALPSPVSYVIAIAGSVAVGKSTAARVIQALLSRWPNHPKVDLVTTDGFLYPNSVLESRGIMNRKGFPESYDLRALLQFLRDLKSGQPVLEVPVYSHEAYDIVPDKKKSIRQPDIVIIEGLNVLQTTDGRTGPAPRTFVSDFFDFSIFIDAKEEHIRRWYVDRFLTFQKTVFQNPSSYFHRYAGLSREDATATAVQIWESINAVNLRQNILPTRDRAQLIIEKGEDHSVSAVQLRKL
ncbi:MAG TPA: type I pantothenate kinase [Terriglobia bacterium]|nr:type I pantothenate kinase [Terriglobia bacterium]